MKAVTMTTSQLINRAAQSILALYAITFIHHVYGGIVDGDTKRLYVPIIGAIPLLITQFSLYQYRRTRGGIALASFSIVTVLWWVIIHGLLHGGYAHTYKDILFLSGVPTDMVQKFYYPLNPTEHYPPDNILFEVTGVLEMVTAYFVALFTLRLIRDGQKDNRQRSLQEQAISSR
jgi:hypothetical protein